MCHLARLIEQNIREEVLSPVTQHPLMFTYLPLPLSFCFFMAALDLVAHGLSLALVSGATL